MSKKTLEELVFHDDFMFAAVMMDAENFRVLRISKRPEPVQDCLQFLVHPARTIELQLVTPSYSKKHLEGSPRVRGRTQNTDTTRPVYL